MDNLYIYNCSKECPPNALRQIQAGKLKGKSDINPVWRIKQLTELFGPCGIGWKICNEKYWTEPGAAGEVSAWCSLELKIKVEGAWSEGISGIGGSMLINTEKGKLVTNDEAYKMAQTDAISVCCKMLGFAADVYWEADRTKYTMDSGQDPTPTRTPPQRPIAPAQTLRPPQQPPVHICQSCGNTITPVTNKGKLYSVDDILINAKNTYGAELCWNCMVKIRNSQNTAGDPV